MADEKNGLKRCDFVLLFDVKDGNPNGDPDAGNLPRMDPETGHGLVTDVCIKRKVRNYVALTRGHESGFGIYVQEGNVLNQIHEQGFKDLGITLASSVRRPIPKALQGVLSADAELPVGFKVVESDGDDAELSATCLEYDASLDKDEARAAVAALKKLHKDAGALASELLKNVKGTKPTREQRGSVQQQLCRQYFDIRTFGAVMSTEVNAGQVRGPVQLTFGRSVDPIVTLEHAVTRVAVTNARDAEKERTMGRKTTVPYGLYVMHGFVSPALAEVRVGRAAQGTGFTAKDLAVFWEALENMFEHDRSAARGLMSARAVVVFEHEGQYGSAPAHALFGKVRVAKRDPGRPARDYGDYEVTVDGQPLAGDRVLHRYGVRRDGDAFSLTRAGAAS